ncbi:PLD3 [Bugula neritina]|uniref:PLD3 n=1 Tax=Bugula neritina TaxID=10212 RepID=A0A7J7JI89_BUGNE|nr:PLD3 [Bugula neritina]
MRQIAFERNIQVRLLASYWNHTDPVMMNYLQSLKMFSSNIDVKVFVVPTYGDQAEIPFSRVNHNKYMVTDRVAYIGTSNWSGDYFLNTAGVGMIFNQSDSSSQTDIRHQLNDVFMRDWKSEYSNDVNGLYSAVNGLQPEVSTQPV